MQLFFYMEMDDVSRTQLFRLFQVLIGKLEIITFPGTYR